MKKKLSDRVRKRQVVTYLNSTEIEKMELAAIEELKTPSEYIREVLMKELNDRSKKEN